MVFLVLKIDLPSFWAKKMLFSWAKKARLRMITVNRALLVVFAIMTSFIEISAQVVSNEVIAKRIEAYKLDLRGPYKDIRWFCEDGSINMPKEPCEDEGVQRARYKDEVDALGKTNHIYLGQILSTTSKTAFWDDSNKNSRLKQYQLGKFLMTADDGWVLRKGQYYRGAFQAEDEEAWGVEFFEWLLKKDEVIREQFFFVRQAIKDIPHQGDDSKTQGVRALSKVISEEYSAFMDIRIKIHGQPEASDIALVRDFAVKHDAKLSVNQKSKLKQLVADMEALYAPVALNTLEKYLKKLDKESQMKSKISAFLTEQNDTKLGADRLLAFAGMIWEIREGILSETKGKGRLALMDISNQLESIMFREASEWQPTVLNEHLQKIYALGYASAGAGFLEKWEWKGTSFLLKVPTANSCSMAELNRILDISRSMVEWGTGIGRANYNEVINQYGGFEPLAFGFLDNLIRSSVLLPLGHSVGDLGDFISRESNLSNQVFSISEQSRIRGINPGYAMGELVVVEGDEDQVEVSSDKIYVFNRPPSDLKPISGICTVTEGNIVSHVQLLARNLGIPNAVLSPQNLVALKPHNGKKVFFAVSNKGTVIMKPASEMNETEQKLFEVKKRKEEKISVPVERVNLKQNRVVNLRELRSNDSGKLCGPKAANLGQLKSMFPDNVVEGFVIPFGVFRAHFDQNIPGGNITYWESLNAIFEEAEKQISEGKSESEVEEFTLKSLAELREKIKKMPLKPEFLSDLNDCFVETFGQPMGKVPVFLRSDTNMEDLKDFTGAGLNLTLFNVVDMEKILNGIKEVWASPYTERSYKWRQKYLNDPENVFPSILVIPSVDVDYSGVMITKGIQNDSPEDITIAFSRGAGGAVDGQAAESFLLRSNGGTSLISPSREPSYRTLPVSGGTEVKNATFEKPILTTGNLKSLRAIAAEIKAKLPNAPGVETNGPWDVELGFKDNKIWLFQVRPFVENKNALASDYLRSITPETDGRKMVSINSSLK